MISNMFIIEKGKLTKIDKYALVKALRKKRMVWIDIENPDKHDTKWLKDMFDFHRISLEDLLHSSQRSKLEEYENYALIVLHNVVSMNTKIATTELDLLLTKNMVITSHFGQLKPIDRIIKNPECIIKPRADFILYLIADKIVDDYFPILGKIDDKIEFLEKKIFAHPDIMISNRLFDLKKATLQLRKLMASEREVYNILMRTEFPYTHPSMYIYFRDIYDHMFRIVENADMQRDMITTTLEAYLSIVSNKLNEIMKTLTIIATIMMPLTLITSFYGMNFKYIAEFEWKYGYFYVLIVMAVITISMLLYFKKKRWI